jgi:hypothetical protein
MVKLDNGIADDAVWLAPTVQKFENEEAMVNYEEGYFFNYGIPIEEYGTIATVLIWNPDDLVLEFNQRDDGYALPLKPDENGTIHYQSMAAWFRTTAPQPENMDILEGYVQYLTQCFKNPLTVTVQ